jgi:hypothetical protein
VPASFFAPASFCACNFLRLQFFVPAVFSCLQSPRLQFFAPPSSRRAQKNELLVTGAYMGSITYAPLRRKAYWEVELNKIKFGDEELELENTGAAIDTGTWFCRYILGVDYESLAAGTSLIAVPTDIAEMLNTMIGAKRSWNGQYTVDCSKVPNLPDISFYFDGQAYPLKGSDYVPEIQGTCVSAFTGVDIELSAGNLWIVGDVFLRRYYTVYDFGRGAVGFAKSNWGGAPVSQSMAFFFPVSNHACTFIVCRISRQ